MAWALHPGGVDPVAGPALALAMTLGVLAVFAPDGIGIREAVIVAYLSYTGVSFSDATALSVSSRLWFMIGEAFLFLTGLLLHRMAPPAAEEGTLYNAPPQDTPAQQHAHPHLNSSHQHPPQQDSGSDPASGKRSGSGPASGTDSASGNETDSDRESPDAGER